MKTVKLEFQLCQAVVCFRVHFDCVLLQCCFITDFGNKYNQTNSWGLMNMDRGFYINTRSGNLGELCRDTLFSSAW